MSDQQKIMYGEYAVEAQLLIPGEPPRPQWFCVKCRRIASSYHSASWCCCTHMICDCGNEHEKHWTMCDTCRGKKASEKWYAKPEVTWDGEWPLALHDSDQYFFDESALIEYLAEVFIDAETIDDIADSLRLTSCYQNKPRTFDINEWCSDDLADDGKIADADSIDDRINAIIVEVGIVSYSADSVRLNVRDVLQRIGFAMEDLK